METAASIEVVPLVKGVQVGEPVVFEDLVVVPLLAPGAHADATLLEEGLADGSSQITEVSAGGSVNAVRAEHRGGKYLLLIDGEEIVGAKQNRVFNASFIIAPGASIEIPVSCVEAGRRGYRSKAFCSSSRKKEQPPAQAV